MVKQKETYIYKIERNNSCLMTDAITIRAYKSKDKNTLMHLLALNTPKYFAAEEKLDFDYYLDKEIESYFVLEYDGKLLVEAE